MIIGGLILRFQFDRIENLVEKTIKIIGLKSFIFFLIIVSGLLSPVISVFIAAVLTAELISILHISSELKTKIAVLSCFSMGIGSGLTPIGEPLAAITIAILEQDFFFLLELLWSYIIIGIVIAAIISLIFREEGNGLEYERFPETVIDILKRAGKVYIFIIGLVLLGRGMSILTPFFAIASPIAVYWLNLISAFIDGGALVPIEISASSTLFQIKSVVISLMVAGIMLIPGSIPNMVVANRLSISNREWAKIGIPLGMAMMIGYFIWLFL